MVSETRINSHNERPEGVEAALWDLEAISRETRSAWFNQLADIPTIYTANFESSLQSGGA